MHFTCPVLLLDVASSTDYTSTESGPMLETLHHLLTDSARFALPHGEIWDVKWIRHGTGDGYYVFLKGESPHLALCYALEIAKNLKQHNHEFGRDLPIHLRLALGFGDVRKITDQWQGGVLVETQRLVDHDGLRGYLKQLAAKKRAAWVLAATSTFHLAWRKDPERNNPHLKIDPPSWTRNDITDKNGKHVKGYVRNLGDWGQQPVVPATKTASHQKEGALMQTPPSPQENPENGDTFTWLHLSDFHFKKETPWEKDVVLESLQREVIGGLPGTSLQPDVVCITGDIAQTGKKEEYENATKFFERVAETLGHDPTACWYVAPGNHDVDRSKVKGLDKKARDHFRNNADSNELLADTDTWATFSKRQAAFLQFTKSFLGPERQWAAETPWRTDFFYKNGRKIAMAALNSAWCCQDDKDEGNILMGEYQVRNALKGTEGAHLRIGLFHHPLDWLKPFDRKRVSGVFSGAHPCHVLLRGHLHETDLEVSLKPSSGTLELAAGACWQDADHPHAVMVGRLDFATRSLNIHVWTYTHNNGGFWAPDNHLYRGMEDGVWRHSFPEKWTFPQRDLAQKPRGPLITSKYRKELERLCGTIENLVRQDKPLVCRLRDVYIPLKTDWLEPALRERQSGKRATEKEQAELKERPRKTLTQLAGHETHRHFLIIGGPGTGKSTFIRFLTLRTVDSGALLPLHLPLKEFGSWLGKNEGEEPSLLVDWATQRLQRFGLDLQPGRLLWLLDGLDEIFSSQLRIRAAKIIGAFLFDEDLGVDRLLITSRPHGLSTEVTNALCLGDKIARILPLDPHDQHVFLTNWFQALYQDKDLAAPVRDDLWQKLSRNQNLSDLRGTPLLLTMIATVYHHGKSLPERRADLYEQAVWVLLSRRYGPDGRQGGGERLVNEMRGILMSVARWMMEQGAVRDMGALDFLKLLTALRPEQTEAELLDVMADLGGNSGLLQQKGNAFSFFHLGFQEFLTARAVAGSSDPTAELEERMGDEAWYEVIQLTVSHLYEMSSIGLGERLVRALMERNMTLAVAGAAGAPPGKLGKLEEDLQERALARLADWKTFPDEQSRYALALALGQLGDPRLGLARRENWIEFKGENVHFFLSRFLVTNQDYQPFVACGGYLDPCWWDEAAWSMRPSEARRRNRPQPLRRRPATASPPKRDWAV